MKNNLLFKISLVFTTLNLLIVLGANNIASASDYVSKSKSTETIQDEQDEMEQQNKVEQQNKIEMSSEHINNTVEDTGNNTTIKTETKNTGIIFIGDSRTVGMDKACSISSNENEFVVARVGQGYNYLKNEALPEVESIRQQNESIDDWVYIINLGINDLGNEAKYKEIYEEIAKDRSARVYIESVNPVNNYPGISNEQVEKINNTFKHINNTSYIDVYNYLLENGFETADGLHYQPSTSRVIYEKIKESIK